MRLGRQVADFVRKGCLTQYKLYPHKITFHDTVEEAVAYALEVEGYRQLWMAILWAEENGVLSPN